VLLQEFTHSKADSISRHIACRQALVHAHGWTYLLSQHTNAAEKECQALHVRACRPQPAA
jgi:hypothetical protein